MITRRLAVLGGAALSACASEPEQDTPQSFLRRAMIAAGGERALRTARVLRWTGTATVHAGGNDIAIGVDTLVQPFSYARSTSWLISQGRAASERVLEIDGTRGFTRRINGSREEMPETQTNNERQQFALYGLMRLVTLLEPGVDVAFSELPSDMRTGEPLTILRVRHPMAVETYLHFDSTARLVGAHNSVSSPNAGEPAIAQDITFSGMIIGADIGWPRNLSIRQNGVPFFDLTLETFTPGEHR